MLVSDIYVAAVFGTVLAVWYCFVFRYSMLSLRLVSYEFTNEMNNQKHTPSSKHQIRKS